MDERRLKKRVFFLIAYLVFAILPVYWMINMSFKTNEEILSTFSLWPRHFTWDHYRTIFTDESWYSGYINSMIYVAINTVISLIYFLIILLLCFILYNWMQRVGTADKGQQSAEAGHG